MFSLLSLLKIRKSIKIAKGLRYTVRSRRRFSDPQASDSACLSLSLAPEVSIVPIWQGLCLCVSSRTFGLSFPKNVTVCLSHSLPSTSEDPSSSSSSLFGVLHPFFPSAAHRVTTSVHPDYSNHFSPSLSHTHTSFPALSIVTVVTMLGYPEERELFFSSTISSSFFFILISMLSWPFRDFIYNVLHTLFYIFSLRNHRLETYEENDNC